MQKKTSSAYVFAIMCILSIVAFFCGCSSYAFRTYITDSPNSGKSTQLSYYIERVCLPDGFLYQTNSFLLQASSERIRNKIIQSRPDVFSDDSNDIHIEISIESNNNEISGVMSLIFPFAVSIYTLPAMSRSDSMMSVSVRRLDVRHKRYERGFLYQEKYKGTLLSPIGLISYYHDPSAYAESRGNGLSISGKQELQNKEYVLAKTISHISTSMLVEMEHDDSANNEPKKPMKDNGRQTDGKCSDNAKSENQ